jgi:hypothetical protein
MLVSPINHPFLGQIVFVQVEVINQGMRKSGRKDCVAAASTIPD